MTRRLSVERYGRWKAIASAYLVGHDYGKEDEWVARMLPVEDAPPRLAPTGRNVGVTG